MSYHRRYAFIGAIATFIIAMLVPVNLAVVAVAEFGRSCLSMDHGVSWQSLREFPAVMFRSIGDLMPVYRESYATDGLSLHRRRRA